MENNRASGCHFAAQVCGALQNRYKPAGTVWPALLGGVVAAVRASDGAKVAIKVSCRCRIAPVPKADGWPKDCLGATPFDLRGRALCDDPYREAAMLRYLHADDVAFAPRAAASQKYLARLVEEVETPDHHFLVTPLAEGGDLHLNLDGRTTPLPVAEALRIFGQVCAAVGFLRSRHVASTDLSIENVCLTESLTSGGNVMLIDFASASVHPASPFARLWSSTRASSLLQGVVVPPDGGTTPGGTTPGDSKLPEPAGGDPDRTFVCARCAQTPGKRRYASPEVMDAHQLTSAPAKRPLPFVRQSFDAYAADVFSLGVILFSLLTNTLPFESATPGDLWFRTITSGKWITPQFILDFTRKYKNPPPYTHLPLAVLNYVRSFFEPEEKRVTLPAAISGLALLSDALKNPQPSLAEIVALPGFTAAPHEDSKCERPAN